MKILHTSDWHLGQIFYGYDRTEEHLDFFRQLQEIVCAEKPDALIVSGDIFDVSSPSSSVMRMFTDFILALHDVSPGMAIVVTSGNHDSASRVDVNRNLWKKAGIHVFGSISRIDGEYDFAGNLVEIEGKGRILAVPYVNRAFMASSAGGESQESVFFGKAAEYVRTLGEDSLPCVLMAHLSVSGCDSTGHRQAQVGNVNSVDSSVFGSVFDYVALGHIHKEQCVGADGRIRYSGAPVAVGFDEAFPHTVTIADVGKGRVPEVRETEIVPLRKLMTFPEPATDFRKALKSLSKIDGDDRSYVRLNVVQDSDLPADFQERACAAVAEKECRFCLIKYERSGSPEFRESEFNLSSHEFSDLSPCEAASRFFNAAGVGEEKTAIYLGMIEGLQKEIDADRFLND